MEWMLLPLKRYAEFSGRSRRKEYWTFSLLMTVVYFIVLALYFVARDIGRAIKNDDPLSIEAPNGIAMVAAIVIVAIGMATFIPSLAVQVRRLHDQDRSGWFLLLLFVPYIGGLIVLAFMLLPGTPGPNRFGPDPKEMDGDALAETFR